MKSWVSDWLENIEKQAKDQQLDVSRAEADRLLVALSAIDQESQRIAETAAEEVRLIESWKDREEEKLQTRRQWICSQLEGYIRRMDRKTLNLAHGVLKVRSGRDRVSVIDHDAFEPAGSKLGLMRTYPEHREPSLQLILAHVKKTGEVPPGVEFIAGTSKFSYQTNNNGETHEQPETEALSPRATDPVEASA